jgi:EmrB/QacA subfamily drug resistance transporter
MQLLDRHRRWLALGTVCLSSLMIVLDATIVNVALPAIQQDLGFSQADLAWVVNAYLLTFGGCMLLAGRTADIVGRRTILIFGIGLFALASLACGLAQSQTMLIAARAIQGVGGSIVSGVSASIVLVLFSEQSERAKALSVWGFVGSGGGTVGVILGGLLTQALNWHWIFLVNVPVGVIAILLARPLLPRTPGIGFARGGVDVAGTLTVLGAPMLAVYGIINAGQAGWTSTTTLVCLAAAALVTVAFILVESRAAAPLVPLRIFRSRTVAVSNIIIAISGAAFFGWFFFSPLYAQQILGYDSLQTGLTFLPATLVMAALSLGLTARIVSLTGPKPPLVAGMLLFTLGMLLFARAPVDGTFVRDILPPMFLLGLGSGLSFMPLFLIATREASADESGLISGLISTSQLIGGAIGLALLAGLAAVRTGVAAAQGASTADALVDGFHAAFLLGAGLGLVSAILAFTQLHEAQTVLAEPTRMKMAGSGPSGQRSTPSPADSR